MTKLCINLVLENGDDQPPICLTRSGEGGDRERRSFPWSGSGVGSYREDELSVLLQIIPWSETSVQVSGVQSSLRLWWICWSVGHLICYQYSIRHQWSSPGDGYLRERWDCCYVTDWTRNWRKKKLSTVICNFYHYSLPYSGVIISKGTLNGPKCLFSSTAAISME